MSTERLGGGLRLVGAVVGGLVLSFLLASAFGWWNARSQDAGFLHRMMVRSESGDPVSAEDERALWTTLERGRFRSVWLFCPTVALLVGTFGGIVAVRHKWFAAVAAAAPFAVMFSVGVQGPLHGGGFLVLYLGVAGAAGWLVGRVTPLDSVRGRPTKG